MAGMDCEPDVKSVEETVAAQLALALARLSLTVTVPRAVGPMVVPGAPEPRLTLSGVVMVSAPVVTVNVVAVRRGLRRRGGGQSRRDDEYAACRDQE